MVAIVSGNSLGLSLTSLATLGQKNLGDSASLGNTGEQTFVNIATGNLVVQDQDDHLMSDGLDSSILRTYNSLGTLDSDGNDTWLGGVYRQEITLSGPLNAAGSIVTRTDRDGAQAAYTWDAFAQLYRSTSGAGAYDTVRFDGATNTFTWTDGSTLSAERYDRTTGKIISSADAHGNTTTYTFTSGQLTRLQMPTGDSYVFNYGISGALAAVSMLSSTGSQVCRVRYEYDSLNRLSIVTTDLTPNDNSIADNATYKTTYGYDGTSKRLASITQSDGTALYFTYDVNTSRLLSVTNGLGQTTSFYYDVAARKTTVTDPLARRTIYEYDASGQLVSITEPALADGSMQITSFAYNAAGDVMRMVDASGNATDMSYDANGNQTLQRDAAGNTITRTYTTAKQLATQTTYTVPDADGAGPALPGGAMPVRYVYDTSDPTLLRFEISAQGRVTEHRYGTAGLMLATLQYSVSLYDTSALAPTQVPTLAQMQTWAASPQPGIGRTDFTYDYRGQLQTRTSFAQVDSAGNPIADGKQSTEWFLYDASGKLIQSRAPNGGLTQYAWDGLWRITSATDAVNTVTLTSYDSANNTVRVTLANGLATTSAYDKAGRLVTVTQSNGVATLGITQYFYDAAGQLAMTEDPTGVRAWMLYDGSGRKIADIDGNGSVIETIYNADDLVTRTIAYATAVNTAALVDINGQPTKPALAAIRPATSAGDQNSWRIYDAANRLCKTVDATGSVTECVYDGASRVVSTIRRYNVVNTAGLGNAPGAANVAIAADAQDRVSRNFYDTDGLLRGTLDAEGYLVEFRYDSAGRMARSLRYAKAASASLRAAGTLEQLIASASSDAAMNAANAENYFVYNTKGQLSGQVDAEGYLTESVYDRNGNLTQSIRYATQVTPNPATVLSVAALRPASTAQDQTRSLTYDFLDRVQTSTDVQGTVTRYTFDSVGKLTKTERALGTSDLRTLTARYDVQGRLTGELTAQGALQLTGGQTQAQIDTIWQQYGLTHAYDAAGRRMSTTDANAAKTLFFYNVDGRLTHTVNALGEVTENQYNVLGQLTGVVRYGTRIALSGLTGALAGGLVNSTLTNAISAVKSNTVDSKTSYAYDQGGRLSSVTDPLSFTTNYVYNTFGEWKTRIEAVTGTQSVTYTAAYDRRGLLTASVDDAGGISASTVTTYDAFGRATRVTDALLHSRSTGYDRLGRVITVTDAGSATTRSTYDAFDRAVTITDARNKVTSVSYDTQARSATITSPEKISVTTYFNRLGDTLKIVDGLGNATTYAYDANGNALSTNTALTTETRTYDRADRLVETVDVNGAHVSFTYDANGFLVGVSDSGQSANNRSFVNDAAGRVLYARQGDHVQRQLVVNGEVMGRYGEVIDDKVARTAEGAPSFTTMADFQFGSQATGGNTPARPDTTHTVGAGDSLKSLAKSYYGDERLWYRIAEANGLFTSDELTAGQVLKIPGTESSLNGSGTFKPYDPSRVVGDTTPFVPLPKPKKMGFFGQVLAAVAAIVVAYLTQQWYLLSYGGAFTGAVVEGSTLTLTSATAAEVAATQVTAAALGGAAGSLASQGVAMAAGVQSGINWKNVGLSAIGGGVSGGLSGVDFTGGASGSVGNSIAHAAIGNTVTQGIGVMTGLQDHFSWQSVAASGVGAGFGQAVGTQLGGSFGGRLATGLIAGGAAAVMRGGRVSLQQVATDAFGQALGNGFVDAMNPPSTDPGAAFAADHANRLRQMNPMNLPTRTSMPASAFAAMGYGNITSDAGTSFGGDVIVGDAPQPVEFSQEQYEAMARGQLQAIGAPRPGFASDGSDNILARSRTMYSDSPAGLIDQGDRRFVLNSPRNDDGWGTYVRTVDPIEPNQLVSSSPAAPPAASTGFSIRSKLLQESDYESVARQLNVEPAALKAVAQVESAGGGFLPSGVPKILFEAHLFSRLTGGQYDASNPDISSPKWNRNLYAGGQGEYDRLAAAMALDSDAALRATSWGKFQILGDNYKLAGYNSVSGFVGAMYSSEANQLQAFSSFVQNRGLVDALQNKDWARFARGYNGPGYQVNHYDEKMFNAYMKFGGQ